MVIKTKGKLWDLIKITKDWESHLEKTKGRTSTLLLDKIRGKDKIRDTQIVEAIEVVILEGKVINSSIESKIWNSII